jgi:hypothetical protein
MLLSEQSLSPRHPAFVARTPPAREGSAVAFLRFPRTPGPPGTLETLKPETLKLIYSEISITPIATSDAPAQRFHPTSSPSRYLASAVSSR